LSAISSTLKATSSISGEEAKFVSVEVLVCACKTCTCVLSVYETTGSQGNLPQKKIELDKKLLLISLASQMTRSSEMAQESLKMCSQDFKIVV
jgi:hypothetical protein